MDFPVFVVIYLLTLLVFPGKTEDCDCDRIYLPLCADDGITYDNDCLFECACKKSDCKLKVVHAGECYDSEK